MTQLAKVIDVSQTFVPVDPNTFPENLLATGREDYPFKGAPVVPFEGYNFMPTAYGYRSYFGNNVTLGIDSLTSRVDNIFIVQTDTYENILVALCEDGIWTKRGDSSGAWTHEVILSIPDIGSHKDWTYCSIGKDVYFYRQGEATYWKMDHQVEYATQNASAVTGLVATVITSGSTPLPAGTYSYQIAYKAADGNISLPCTAVSATLAASGSVNLKWTKLALADTHGYRIYRTSAGVTKYKDVVQSSSATNVYLTDANDGWTVITLPDTSAPIILHAAYSIRAKTPTFLNMTGQIGIFKAGGRLGFWDSENSVAWSSLDDFLDFTPDIETLAGSAIFVEVSGRITAIAGHGEGFVVYATKSVVYIKQDVSATFQWNPNVVLTKSGISFPSEVTVSIPDTTHFAWTDTGLYKIVNGLGEVIVPEVTDFLKESNDPIYLKMLEGRYLSLGILDPDYINGLVQFSTNQVDASTFTFPGGTSLADTIPETTISGTDVCATFNGLGSGSAAEQQAMGDAARIAAGTPAKKAGSSYTPVWTAYFSNGGGWNADNISWGNDPVTTADVNGTEINMCPVPKAGGLLSNANMTTTGKTAVTGSAYVDGHMTIERFIATQEAIWELEAKGRDAWIQKVLNRASSTSKTESGVSSCVASGPTVNRATIGTYIAGELGSREFGFNGCSFWLTRYIDKSIRIDRVRAQRVTCSTENAPTPTVSANVVSSVSPYNVNLVFGQNPQYTTVHSIQEAIEVFTACFNAYAASSGGAVAPMAYNDMLWAPSGIPGSTTYSKSLLTYAVNGGYIAGSLTANSPAGWFLGTTGDDRGTLGFYSYNASAPSTRITTVNAYNDGVAKDIGPIADTGICLLTGWTYTDINNVSRTIGAAGVCSSPTSSNPSDGGTSINGLPAPSPVGGNGSICSIPFEPVTIAAVQADPIVWPDQTVTVPSGSFLLQDGSIGPIYPTLAGALVYDLHLKKWGKLKCNYKQLLDYSPINSSSGAIIDEEIFGVRAGALKADGTISLFDQFPLDSYIKYGKIGYYRLGYSSCEEVKIQFRTPSNGSLAIETSLDGRTTETMLGSATSFTDCLLATLNSNSSGRWHSIIVRGNYDITHLEFRGTVQGRR